VDGGRKIRDFYYLFFLKLTVYSRKKRNKR
jgi:hypothetical protein